MFSPPLMLVYVILSLIMGLLGRNKYLGFWGYVLLSLLFTPLFTGLVLFITRDRPRAV